MDPVEEIKQMLLASATITKVLLYFPQRKETLCGPGARRKAVVSFLSSALEMFESAIVKRIFAIGAVALLEIRRL